MNSSSGSVPNIDRSGSDELGSDCPEVEPDGSDIPFDLPRNVVLVERKVGSLYRIEMVLVSVLPFRRVSVEDLLSTLGVILQDYISD